MIRVSLVLLAITLSTLTTGCSAADPTKRKKKDAGDSHYAPQSIDRGRSTDAQTCSFRCPVYDKLSSDSIKANVRELAGRSYCNEAEAERFLDYVFEFEDPTGMRTELKGHLLDKQASFKFATEDGKPIIVFSGGFGVGKSRMAELASQLFSYRWREDMRAGDALVDFKCSTHKAKTPEAVRTAFFEKLAEVAKLVGTRLPFVILLDDLHTLSSEQIEVALKPIFDRDRYYGEHKPADAINKMLPRSLIIATVDFGQDMEMAVDTFGKGEKRLRHLTVDELRDKTLRVLRQRYGDFVASRIAVYPMPSFDASGHRRATQYKLYHLPCAHRKRDKIRCFYWTARAEWALINMCINPVVAPDSHEDDDGGGVEINGRLTENVFRRNVNEPLRIRIDEHYRGTGADDTFRVRPGDYFSSSSDSGAGASSDSARARLLRQFKASREKQNADRLGKRTPFSFIADLWSALPLPGKKRSTVDVAMYYNESSSSIDFIVADELLDCSVPKGPGE